MMSGANPGEIDAAIGMLPGGHFLMTSAYEGKRAGHIIRSVQVCSDQPRLLCVAARKGHSIAPLIRDSHQFAICVIAAADTSLLRRFEAEVAPDELGDAFDALAIETLHSHSPVLKRSPCRHRLRGRAPLLISRPTTSCSSEVPRRQRFIGLCRPPAETADEWTRHPIPSHLTRDRP
jgi:hypothetical protein